MDMLKQLNNAIAYIEANLREEVHMDELAKIAKASRADIRFMACRFRI